MNSEENLICSICGKGPFKDARGLNGHKAIVHGVEKRIIQDSQALELLKELAAKVDRVLVGQEQGIADLEQVGRELPQSMSDLQKANLRPFVEGLGIIETAVTNELPHQINDLNTVAAQVGAVVEEKEKPIWGHIRSAEQETDQAAKSKTMGEEAPAISVGRERTGDKLGWYILAGIGVWVLGNYLKQKAAEQRGAASPGSE